MTVDEKNEIGKLYRVSQERGGIYNFNKVVRKDSTKQGPFQRTLGKDERETL